MAKFPNKNGSNKKFAKRGQSTYEILKLAETNFLSPIFSESVFPMFEMPLKFFKK
jgi:hypothetical protein